MKQIFLVSVLVSFFSLNLKAKLIIHPNQVIQSYWGDQSKISSETLLFSDKDKKSIFLKFKIKLKENIYKIYKVSSAQGLKLGEAFLYTDVVKTKKMTLLLLISPAGDLENIEVIAFSEPAEYQPSKKWLKNHYSKKKLAHFSMNKNSANITGATLSAQVVYQSALSMASIYHFLKEKTP